MKKKICALIIVVCLIFLPSFVKCAWLSYYFAEGDFFLSIPQNPVRKVSHLKNYVSYIYQSCLNDCMIAYTASFTDYGNEGIAKYPSLALESVKSRILRSTHGTLTYESYIEYEGYPGKENKFNVDTHLGLYVCIQRVYIVDGKIYDMMVTTPIKYQFMPEHYMFLDSFKIRK